MYILNLITAFMTDTLTQRSYDDIMIHYINSVKRYICSKFWKWTINLYYCALNMFPILPYISSFSIDGPYTFFNYQGIIEANNSIRN